MNEHQHRLWIDMLDAIDGYRSGDMTLSRLIGELQGALEAGDFKDQVVTKQFYDLWQPLEITNAVRGDEAAYEEVADDLDAIQLFLREHLVKPESKRVGPT